MDPSRYLSNYRWEVIALAALTGVVAVVVGSTRPPQYESTVKMRLEPIQVQEEILDPFAQEDTLSSRTTEVDLDTQAAVARSMDVEQIAADKLNLQEARGLAGLTVAPIEGTRLLQFTYGHGSPEVARERAQAFAEAYLEFRRRVLVGSAIHEAAELQEMLDSVEMNLREKLARAGRVDNAATRESLQSFAGVLEGTATRIEFDLSRLADVPPVGSIIEPAGLPRSQPSHLINGMAGLMVGFVAGIGYAARRSRRDERILSQEQLESHLGVPVLATVPPLAGWRWRSSLVTRSGGLPPTAEAYGILRTNLVSVAEAHNLHTVVVTSALPGEGKSITAANLAGAVARSAKRVALVSGDLRSHRLSELLDVPASPGLTEVLATDVALEGALVPAWTGGMDILPSGTLPDDPALILGSPAMADVLRALADRYDLIIIDAASVLGRADTIALAPLADGVLFVADARNATPGVLSLARKQLEQVDAHLLGAVFNRRRLSRKSHSRFLFPRSSFRDAAALFMR
jgi:capsular exopolysaccharide synthesis family protein